VGKLVDAPFIDDSMADSGTAINLLRQKFPGMFAAAAPTMDSGAPVVPPKQPVDTTAPDIGQGAAPAAPFVLPWLRQFQQQQPQRPPISSPTGQWTPGTTKAQKLEVMLRNGLQGAIAGAGADAQAVVQSGGRRSGGFGLGAAAGFEAPAQQTQVQQNLQRGSLENQALQNQTQFAPALNFLKILQGQAELGKTNAETGKASAEAGKATAEAGAVPTKTALESAQTEAAYFKDDPNLGLIDLRTRQPVTGAGFAPLSADEAAILGKQPGDNVPLKIKNSANEMVNRGIKSVSANGRQLLVDNKGNTIKDMGQATPMAVINAQQQPTPVTPEMKNAVDMVGNGKVDLATALSPFRRFPGASESFLSDLNARYPDYSQATYGVSKQTMQYFTTGAGGNELNAFRTAIAHADLLDQAATALQNKNTKAYNTAKNALKTQFGDPEPTNFNVIANAYTREVTKAISAGHITNSEVDTQGATMPQNAGPQQIHGAMEAYKNLMASKAQQRMLQYEQGLQGKPAFPAGMGGATNNAPKAPTFADWKAKQGKS
jgi:hypothetical protein